MASILVLQTLHDLSDRETADAARWAREKLHGEVFGSFRTLEEH